MSEQPPPGLPLLAGGPPAPRLPSACSSQPAAFPGPPYQTYYQGPLWPPGPPGSPGPPGPFLAPPGYLGYQSGPPRTSHPWDGPKKYGEPPKNTVFVVDPHRGDDDGGVEKSCLAACSAALCCCCLLDMLTHDHC